MTRRTRIRWDRIDANTPVWTEVRTPHSHELATFMGLVDGKAQVVYPHDGPGAIDLIDPALVLEEIR